MGGQQFLEAVVRFLDIVKYHHHHHHHHLFNKTDRQNAIIHNIKKHENLINVIEENFVQMITTVVRLLGGNC